MVRPVQTNNKGFPRFLTEADLMQIFKKYDFNHDGLLSKAELKEAFKNLGSIIPGFRADRAFKHADADGDGYISEGEMNDLVKYASKLGFTNK